MRAIEGRSDEKRAIYRSFDVPEGLIGGFVTAQRELRVQLQDVVETHVNIGRAEIHRLLWSPTGGCRCGQLGTMAASSNNGNGNIYSNIKNYTSVIKETQKRAVAVAFSGAVMRRQTMTLRWKKGKIAEFFELFCFVIIGVRFTGLWRRDGRSGEPTLTGSEKRNQRRYRL